MRLRFLLFLVAASGALAFAPSFPARRGCSGAWIPTAAQAFATTSTSSSTEEIATGLLKTISTPGNGQRVKLGDIATVKYACYLPDQVHALPFAKSSRQTMMVGDTGMIPGWDAALRSMTVGERSVVRIMDPSLAYGSAGVPPVVPPDAVVELDIQLLEAQPAMENIDFDSLAAVADKTPRTASEIAAAFQKRQLARADEPVLEGLELWIAKAKKFYFYGLFEGETGERPPWFLRPSITFPLAFLIVGLTFYVSVVSGAISERGAQVTDELDDIILSSTSILETPAMFLATMSAIFPMQIVDLGL
jgi:hypothetical protein